MKLVALVLGFVALTNVAHAESGLYQEALVQTLASDNLKAVTEQFWSFELTETKIKKEESKFPAEDKFSIHLFYSAIGTAGGCYVDAKVTHSMMEIVKPGGGFEIRHIWNVEAERGICPR